MDDHLPLSDETDRDILMHRDAHFGGLFDEMLEYYQKEGKGVQPHFDLRRIEYLKKFEEDAKENLALLLLTGADAERIGASRLAYKKLRDLYEQEERLSKLIADLILTEDEEAEEEVAAIVKEKNKMIPYLLDLLRSEEFHDPLFPGYGKAPYLAAKCLGQIGDKRVLFNLFEELGSADFENEEMLIKAIRTMGQPAKEFLLRVLQQRPIGRENELAALVLIEFKNDLAVSEIVVKLLEEQEMFKNEFFCEYLILLLEDLKDPSLITRAKKIFETLPKGFQLDAHAVMKSWIYTETN